MHICTSTQCTWHVHKEDIAKKRTKPKPGAAEVPDKNRSTELICWATGRSALQIGDDEDEMDLSTLDRPLHAASAGNEKRLMTFKSETTGQTVTQMVDRPHGTDIGKAASTKTYGATMADLQREQTLTEASVRQADADRRATLKRKRGDDAGESSPTGCSPDRSELTGSISLPVGADTDGSCPKRQRSAISDNQENADFKIPEIRSTPLSRLATAHSQLASVMQRRACDDFGNHKVEDEGDEGDDVYMRYNVIDLPDYDRDEEIGDYATGYTAAGGVEALAEEEEDIGGACRRREPRVP